MLFQGFSLFSPGNSPRRPIYAHTRIATPIRPAKQPTGTTSNYIFKAFTGHHMKGNDKGSSTGSRGQGLDDSKNSTEGPTTKVDPPTSPIPIRPQTDPQTIGHEKDASKRTHYSTIGYLWAPNPPHHQVSPPVPNPPQNLPMWTWPKSLIHLNRNYFKKDRVTAVRFHCERPMGHYGMRSAHNRILYFEPTTQCIYPPSEHPHVIELKDQGGATVPLKDPRIGSQEHSRYP
ncbi:hypothetical protein L211DRAFT_889889 [Terfezia boudieri ATCC MYA-4762]|uniref:Uncharacterized protein n=1 Tax=Terfezia boudieri ATCC MYA-4762 TaxID=1051890 RepID=A0A3N4LET5_9PEZI|nr:hypothetical protein L211DRAFT_889889 [Terfezia boudieri ATCC MYA-4762]